MLHVCNSLLASFEKELPVLVLHVDISNGKILLQLNEVFASGGFHGLLEAKNYQRVYMLFSFYLWICVQGYCIY